MTTPDNLKKDPDFQSKDDAYSDDVFNLRPGTCTQAAGRSGHSVHVNEIPAATLAHRRCDAKRNLLSSCLKMMDVQEDARDALFRTRLKNRQEMT